jgi:hypothetical protein
LCRKQGLPGVMFNTMPSKLKKPPAGHYLRKALQLTIPR